MPTSRLRAALLGLALLPLPVLACDMEAINAEYTAICRAAIDPVAGWAAEILPRVGAEDATRLRAALTAAGDACDSGDPAMGARQAVEIARILGRLEMRATLAAQRH